MAANLKLGLVVVLLGGLLAWLLSSERTRPEEVHRVELAPSAAEAVLPTHAVLSAPPAAVDLESPAAAASLDTSQPVEQDRADALEIAALERLRRAHGLQGVWVQVVDDQGRPLEGVDVVLRDTAHPEWSPTSEATSDASGRLWMSTAYRVNPGTWRVEPAGPGGAEAGVAVTSSGYGDEPVLLVLDVGAGLDVHVVDERGTDTDGTVVQLVMAADFDAQHGYLPLIHRSRVAKGQAAGGVCSFERLPVDAEVVLAVKGPPPLGSTLVRARTPARGLRARVEARFSEQDLLVLGAFVGQFADSDWNWDLFAPGGPEPEPWAVRNPLDVGEDGGFVVRLPPAQWGQFASGACLAIGYGQVLLEIVDLAPMSAPAVVQLDPMSVFSPILGSGHVVLLGEGEPQKIRLGLAGNRSGADPVRIHALGHAQPDARGAFSFRGRVPTGWRWRFESLAKDWEVVSPAEFQPGRTDYRVELRRVGGPSTARVVPGDELSRNPDWVKHVAVELRLRPIRPRESRSSSWEMRDLSRDGRFEVGHPLERVRSIAVRGSWRGRPLLEREVVPGDSLELHLPAGLRLVRLDVRGEDGVELRAEAGNPDEGPEASFRWGASSPVSVLLDRPTQDVLVRAHGYRDTLVKAVGSDRRVDLVDRATPLRLRALHMPGLPAGVTLRPVLARGPRGDVQPPNDPAFDSKGEATVHAPGLGEYYVHIQWERLGPSGRGMLMFQGADNPRILVPEPTAESGPLEYELTYDWARLLQLMEGND